MSREWKFYLEDMIESCRKIIRFTEGLTQDAFVRDEKCYDAVIRNLEIIGEAAKHIPPEIQKEIPHIDWKKAAGMRDMLAHAWGKKRILLL